jgi:predicted phosphoadenosine phosphosulfate sulfurtransferase
VDDTPGGNDMPGRLVFSTTPNGSDTLSERLRITSKGILEKTQQTNVRTFEFAFSGGVGGSTTTQNIATLSNTTGSTMAIAHIDYVSNYGIANDYIHCGIWACSTRRKNSNTGWNAVSNQVANGGSSDAGPVVCGWVNGVLQFTVTAFMGYTIHVSLTVYNADCAINAL